MTFKGKNVACTLGRFRLLVQNACNELISTYKGIFMFVFSVSKYPVLMSFYQSEFDC